MKSLVILSLALILVVSSAYSEKKDEVNLQRLTQGTFDLQSNTLSNFEFKTTNYGIFGMDIATSKGSGVWPRGTQNQYLFANGFWFGAKKIHNGTNLYRKLVTISYNPNSGRGWYVPGEISDGDTVNNNLSKKYRTYFSTDFDLITGKPLINDDGPNWPVWIKDKNKKYHYGTFENEFVTDENLRNLDNKPLGPLFVSDEDIISIFKDTDMNWYEGGKANRLEQGYPLKTEVQSSIYSWGEGDMYDIIIQSYILENKSTDTLSDCWFAGIYDTDIGVKTDTIDYSDNDKIKYYDDDKSLNLAVAWTNTDFGEKGKGFGYLGLCVLESPAVDEFNNIRNDKLIFDPEEQLGLVTFRNWNITFDPQTDSSRYDWISSSTLDGDTGPGDKRMMFATGPFNMKPGDKARVAFALAFAMPAKGGEADGTLEDIAGLTDKTNKGDGADLQSTGNSLIDKIKRAYFNYYNGIAMTVRSAEPNLFDANVYPNPANDIATFDYSIKTAGNYKISILDNQGKEVAKVFSGNRTEGNYHHFIELSKYNLSNGMYFIKIVHGSNFSVKKMMVIN